LTGRDAANLLREANIVSNFNTIPFDPQSPRLGSGIRPGSPALTSRGMKEPEMVQVANLMADVLLNPTDTATRERVREDVVTLCDRFPLYDFMACEGEFV
jgi:glycine hydroxymethyltransferase